MNDMLTRLVADTNFWVMISTIICVGFIASKAKKPVIDGLNDRAEQIRLRLAEAEALRNEAKALLEEYKQKSEDAMQEAEAIMANAQRRADQMRADMEEELKDSIARQEQNAKNRIARLEEDAMQTIKTAIISEAMNKVKSQVANDTPATASLDHAMDDLKKILQK